MNFDDQTSFRFIFAYVGLIVVLFVLAIAMAIQPDELET